MPQFEHQQVPELRVPRPPAAHVVGEVAASGRVVPAYSHERLVAAIDRLYVRLLTAAGC